MTHFSTYNGRLTRHNSLTGQPTKENTMDLNFLTSTAAKDGIIVITGKTSAWLCGEAAQNFLKCLDLTDTGSYKALQVWDMAKKMHVLTMPVTEMFPKEFRAELCCQIDETHFGGQFMVLPSVTGANSFKIEYGQSVLKKLHDGFELGHAMTEAAIELQARGQKYIADQIADTYVEQREGDCVSV